MRRPDPYTSGCAFALVTFGALTFATAAAAQVAEPAQANASSRAPLSLVEALRQAESTDPRIRAAEAGVLEARGGVMQARARPNPTLALDVENFGGRGAIQGLDGAETTLRLSQQIERGARRDARIAVADQDTAAAEIDARIARLDVYEDVQRAYYDALAKAALVEIADERLATAEAMQASVVRRVAAARDPLLAGARAEAGTAEARVALDAARTEAAIARTTLASLIGSDPSFHLDLNDLAPDARRAHAHDADLAALPDMARIEAMRRRARAETRLERARGHVDPTLSLGVRRFEADGETGLVAGVSLPLALFDRNRGAIARANAAERRADYDLQVARQRLDRDTQALKLRLDSAAKTVAALERTVIPQAERALTLAREGYAQGGFSYLDVLEAQRALSAARQSRIETLRAYHTTEAALDRLTARFASGIGEETSQ